jgi:hypothetical protein
MAHPGAVLGLRDYRWLALTLPAGRAGGRAGEVLLTLIRV